MFIALPASGQSHPPEMVLQVGHNGYITASAVSRDGRTVAFGGEDKTVRLWDTHSGQLKRALTQGENQPLLIDFSPDNKKVVIADRNSDWRPDGQESQDPIRLRFWNIDSGRHLSTVRGFNHVVALAMSPDWKLVAQVQQKQRLASRWQPGVIALTNARTGKLLRTLSTTEEKEPNLIFSPDGSILAGVGWAGTRMWAQGEPWRNPIRLWNVHTGRLFRTLDSQDNVLSAAFSPDGRRLVSVGFSESKSENWSPTYHLQVWDVRSGKLLRTVSNLPKDSMAVAFAPTGQTLLSRSYRDITLWSTQTWKPLQSLRQANMFFEEAIITANNHVLASNRFELPNPAVGFSGVYSRVKMWNILTGKEIWNAPAGRAAEEQLTSIELMKDKKTLLGKEVGKTFKLWDTRTMREKETYRATAKEGTPIALSPNGEFLVRSIKLARFQSAWRVWKTKNGRLQTTLSVPGGGFAGPTGCYFSHSSQKLVVTSASDVVGYGGVTLWDLKTGTAMSGLDKQQSEIVSLAFSPDDQKLALSTWQGPIVLWDVSHSRLLGRLSPSKAKISAVIYSPDGAWLAGGDETGVLRVWDSRSRELKSTWKGHQDQILSLNFSADRSLLVSTGRDGSVKIWRLGKGKVLEVFNGQVGSNPMALLLSDGKTLLSSNLTGQIKFWDLRTKQLLLTYQALPAKPGDPKTAEWIAYTPDGHYTGAPNVEQFIRWRISKKLLPANAFRQRYFRADLVESILENKASAVAAFPSFKTAKTMPPIVPSKPKVGGSKMDRRKVLNIAKQMAIKNGYHLKDYLEPMASFDSNDRKWTVILDHKPPAFPGSRSLVFVNDQNGKATLFHGQ